jgi:hypothetical protein
MPPSEETVSGLDNLLKNVPIPDLIPLRQRFPRPCIEDPGAHFLARLRASGVLNNVKAGQSIAVAVGSRGIVNQPLLVGLLVAELKSKGVRPFIVPAMGSHGGASAEGQERMLADLGVSAGTVGAPVRSSMEVLELGVTPGGLPVYMDRAAAEADGIVLINRVKQHVAFRGPYESGLFKMLAIGLGKQKGAEVCHNLGFARMPEHIPALARAALRQAKVLFGVALVENGYHETARIEVIPAARIEAEEPELLREAKTLSARLYFPVLDVLVIDEVGKDITGTGFDLKIAGRYSDEAGSEGPEIARIALLSLTAVSHGNANGLGLADFITRRLFESIDTLETYPNSLTTTDPLRAKIPMILESDRRAIQAAIKTCHLRDLRQVRLARIRNTLSLEEISVSAPALESLEHGAPVESAGEARPLVFNERGDLF